MIYITGLIAGMANGFFASGAGQLLVFSLVYILKKDTHSVRACSVLCMGIATAVSLYGYTKFVSLEVEKILLVAICGAAFGWLGAFFMKKIDSKMLNLISGIVIFAISAFNLLKR